MIPQEGLVLNNWYVDEEYAERHCKGKRSKLPDVVPLLEARPKSPKGLDFSN
jgi:hypothetical protein